MSERILLVAIVITIIGAIGWIVFSPQGLISYLTDDPQACNNCHVMNEPVEGWSHARHNRVAVCNDCHTPHSPIRKWVTKFLKGAQHVFFFTTGIIPAQIRANASTRRTVQENCIRCHERLAESVPSLTAGDRLCFDCHRTIAHGERRSPVFLGR